MTAPSASIDPADHLPDYNAAAGIKGLSETVDIWRDEWGIPHVRGKTYQDAFAGLGFAQAQDRLWQMEALLRRGTGRYAEWLGARAVAGDILARQMNAAAASQRDFALLSQETKAMLEAYARGVNAFTALGQWPIEYKILNCEPARWEPWHSIAVMRQIGFLMGSVWWKLWRAAALPIVGADNVAKLRFDDGGSDLLCVPPGVEGKRLAAASTDLKPGISSLLATAQDQIGAELDGGSNNWAISADRTSTGRPIVAGDPHRVLEMPNMYAQAHLACDEFDIIGLTVPGVPGFPHFGHTADVAWSVTHAFVDIHDLYVEKFDAGAQHCRFKGAMVPTTRRAETIKVRDGDDVALDVIETHHGPVIAGDPLKGTAVALKSVQFAVPDKSFDCLLPMLRARSIEQLFEATRGFGLMDHNVVAGDTGGKIGHRVRALVPARPRANGWLPVPGWTGEHEWNGMVPFEDMPASIAPARGMIVTANNRVVEPEREPYLSTDPMPPHRTRRIWQRLEALERPSPEQMSAIHRDLVSIPAIEIRERLRSIGTPVAANELREQILGWNGEMRADSVAAAAYAAVRLELTKLAIKCAGLDKTADSDFTKVAPGIFPEVQFWWTLPQLLRTNDETLLNGATWDELLREAVVTVAATKPKADWGTLHTPKLRHALSSAFPDYADMLDKDCATISGDNDCVFMAGYSMKFGWQATSSALSRYVFDVGAWNNCQWIVFHGASGHPASPFYRNQNVTWAQGEMVPMLYDWATIKGSARTHLSIGKL